MLLLIFKIYQIAQVCLCSLCSSVLVCLWSLLMFFSVCSLWSLLMFFGAGMSVVITYVLQCWYSCGHYLCCLVLVSLWSLLMFFSVGMSVDITYFLQCWLIWRTILAQTQVKFPWQLILMIQSTPYNLNPRLLQPCTINSS